MITMTRSDIEANSYRLKALMSISPKDSIMIDTTTIVDFKPDQIIFDTAALSEQRSDVRQIDQTIEVMRLNQQLQKFQALKQSFKDR